MNILISWLANAVIIVLATYFVPGVHIESFVTALVVAVVLGILNITVKPLLSLLTLPITLLTLGLFGLVLNAVMLLIADALVPGFKIDNFVAGLIYSLILSVLNMILSKIIR